MESHNNMFCMLEWIEDPVSGLLLSDIITSQETVVGQNIIAPLTVNSFLRGGTIMNCMVLNLNKY